MILGTIERGDKLHLKLDKRPDQATPRALIMTNVLDKAKVIMTDEYPAHHGRGCEDTRH